MIATAMSSSDEENVERKEVEESKESEDSKESESDGNVTDTESDQPSPVALDPEMEAEISSTTPLKEAIKETGNVITCL
jgi:hypothetical protein